MNWFAPAAAIPGRRIEGYRNSAPRLIRLVGLGKAGSKVARTVAERALPNVEVMTSATAVGWADVASERSGVPTNMIVVVCAEGDQRLFCPEQGKPEMPVTFVLLRNNGCADRLFDEVASARSFSDLFVTTSDANYVSDLIDNLAS
ncbi:MAG TPA: hypothetical protein VH684_22540 [Xanthobacteraceae bacterium]|jgi:hypothetical protein